MSLGHNFWFFICLLLLLLFVHVVHFSSPFLFCLVLFHSALGADFVWKEIFLFVSAVRYRSSPGAGFVSEKIVWGIRSKTVRLWDPGFCLKPSISVHVVVQFYPWFNFYFLLFLGMVIYDNELKTKENKN